MTELSEQIRQMVKLSEKTQRQIALDAGITEISLSRYISGDRQPKAMTYERIKEACNNQKSCVLTSDEAFAVSEFIDKNLYDNIRNDEDIDSIQWLRNLLHAYEKMCTASGYVGMTEHEVSE